MAVAHAVGIILVLLADVTAPPAPAVSVPNWVPIPPPSKALLSCASYSSRDWRVSLVNGAVQIRPYRGRPETSGPRLPFAPPIKIHPAASRHVLAVPGGFLLGTDAGEFDGQLNWLGSDGRKATKLGDDNVQGIIRVGATQVLVLEGLNHLGVQRGWARWLKPSNGAWETDERLPLDAGPEAYAVAADAVYVITPKSLTRIEPTRQMRSVYKTRSEELDPSSMVVDGQGSLWIGMRHFVLRLSPDGAGFNEHWMARKGCERATLHYDECICEH